MAYDNKFNIKRSSKFNLIPNHYIYKSNMNAEHCNLVNCKLIILIKTVSDSESEVRKQSNYMVQNTS